MKKQPPEFIREITECVLCHKKIKEALHFGWEKPSLNKQVNHVKLTLFILIFRVTIYT